MGIKTCILAGGLGTRISEETVTKPKPMVEIGGSPILWHIMKMYSSYGFNEFIIALGYKGEVIKDYFLNLSRRSSDLQINLASGDVKVSNRRCDPWAVELIDTGLNTHTGGRVKRLCEKAGEGPLFLTYGDGVSNVDIRKLLEFHKSHGKLATVTAVHPPARFGAITFEKDQVAAFDEKPYAGEGWINGGFFVLEPEVAEYIASDDMPFEKEPLAKLAEAGELMGYRHEGFWQCMDTIRDLKLLEDLWQGGNPPWRTW